MRILAIETSCDDTSIAILEAEGEKQLRFKVLASVVSSQVKVHRKWGGIVPTLAKREHQKNLVPVIKMALKKAKLLKTQNIKSKVSDRTISEILDREELLLPKLNKFLGDFKKPAIDLISVTTGPGLEPALWVGVNFAKALAYFWKLPIIPVNHIEAHILANFIDKSKISNLPPSLKSFDSESLRLDELRRTGKSEIFPAICLIVSGGHTLLILMENIGKYKVLGETRDDAAGECFDKVARILGLGYPGGPAIAAEAAKLKSQISNLKITLPRPMIHAKNYDFSFSGLKTAVLYKVRDDGKKSKDKNYIREMCREVQQAIIDVLVLKTVKAISQYQAKNVLIGGGVAANSELRKQLYEKVCKEMPNTGCFIPEKQYCTDNAAMTAVAGYFRAIVQKKHANWQEIEAQGNLDVDKLDSLANPAPLGRGLKE